MAVDRRVSHVGAAKTGEHRGTGCRAALLAFAAVALWACTPGGGGAPDGAGATDGGQAPDSATVSHRKIIVEFSLPGGVEDGAAASGQPAVGETAARDVAERILSRLGPRIRESARIFDLLPLIALEADAATVMRLLLMPEVLSIRPDREVLLPVPPKDIADPDVPSGDRTE